MGDDGDRHGGGGVRGRGGERQRDRETERQRDRETERQRERDRERGYSNALGPCPSTGVAKGRYGMATLRREQQSPSQEQWQASGCKSVVARSSSIKAGQRRQVARKRVCALPASKYEEEADPKTCSTEEEEAEEHTLNQPVYWFGGETLLLIIVWLLRMLGGRQTRKVGGSTKEVSLRKEETRGAPSKKLEYLKISGKRAITKGDGNCMWRAFAKATQQRRSWRKMKKEALRQMASAGADPEWIAQQRCNRAWGTQETLAWLAKVSDTMIYVDADADGLWTFGDVYAARRAFLGLRRHHFQPIKDPLLESTSRWTKEGGKLAGGGFMQRFQELQDDMLAGIVALTPARESEWEYQEGLALRTVSWLTEIDDRIASTLVECHTLEIGQRRSQVAKRLLRKRREKLNRLSTQLQRMELRDERNEVGPLLAEVLDEITIFKWHIQNMVHEEWPELRGGGAQTPAGEESKKTADWRRAAAAGGKTLTGGGKRGAASSSEVSQRARSARQTIMEEKEGKQLYLRLLSYYGMMRVDDYFHSEQGWDLEKLQEDLKLLRDNRAEAEFNDPPEVSEFDWPVLPRRSSIGWYWHCGEAECTNRRLRVDWHHEVCPSCGWHRTQVRADFRALEESKARGTLPSLSGGASKASKDKDKEKEKDKDRERKEKRAEVRLVERARGRPSQREVPQDSSGSRKRRPPSEEKPCDPNAVAWFMELGDDVQRRIMSSYSCLLQGMEEQRNVRRDKGQRSPSCEKAPGKPAPSLKKEGRQEELKGDWDPVDDRTEEEARKEALVKEPPTEEWFLQVEGSVRCLLCRKWMGTGHGTSPKHVSNEEWFRKLPRSEQVIQLANMKVMDQAALKKAHANLQGGGGGKIGASEEHGSERGCCTNERNVQLRDEVAESGSMEKSEVHSRTGLFLCGGDGYGGGPCEPLWQHARMPSSVSTTLPFLSALPLPVEGPVSSGTHTNFQTGAESLQQEDLKIEEQEAEAGSQSTDSSGGAQYEECTLKKTQSKEIPAAQSFWSFSRLKGSEGKRFLVHHPQEWNHEDIEREWRQQIKGDLSNEAGGLRPCAECKRRRRMHVCTYEIEPSLSGGGKKGKGEGAADETEEDHIGAAIRTVRFYQVEVLIPQHLRVLLQAKPKVAEKIMGLRDSTSIAKVLRVEAGRAKLPCQEDTPKERARSQAPAKQVSINTGKGRASSIGPAERARGGGKGKPASSSGGGKPTQQNCPTPRLVPEEWPIPIADSITAGDNVVMVVPEAEDVTSLVKRMKGTVGPAGLVSLKKCPNYERQEEIVSSLVCYSEDGPKICSTHVWLVQAGTTDVIPQQVRKEIQIKPRKPKTVVTGISFWKPEVDAEMLAELKERKLHKAREFVSKICEKDVSEVDAFKLRDEKEDFQALVRIPTQDLEKCLKASGKGGVFIRTPYEQLEDYHIMWLQGDAATTLQVAEQTSEKKKYTNHGLVRNRGKLGVRLAKEAMKEVGMPHGLDDTPIYWVKGVPPEMCMEELEDFLAQIQWAGARVEEKSRRVGSGGATWKVRSATSPSRNVHVASYGLTRCQLSIEKMGGRRIQKDKTQDMAEVPQKASWAETVAPRIQRPQTKPPTEVFRTACQDAKEQAEQEEGRESEEQQPKRQRSATRKEARSPMVPRTLPAQPGLTLEGLAQQQARTERMLQQILAALQNPQGVPMGGMMTGQQSEAPLQQAAPATPRLMEEPGAALGRGAMSQQIEPIPIDSGDEDDDMKDDVSSY